jgi:phospholipid transport system substrate-binding protein
MTISLSLGIKPIYSRAFVEYKDWSIRFTSLKMLDEDTKVTVITQVLQSHQQPVQVNNRLFLSNGNW